MLKSTLALAVAATLAGCAGTPSENGSGLFTGASAQGDDANVDAQAHALARGQDAWMQPFVYALYRDGEWGAVLNLERLGLAAMEKQRFALASKAFDQAIVRVEAIYADDPNAAKARSVFNEEQVKDFKGEPYERAMLYFYRGLLYARDGDYQNARASFLAADRHDTLSSAEDSAFAGKFGLMKYLAGWASQCAGEPGRATQLVREARAADAKITALPQQPANSVVLVDSGPAPVKWGDGEYKEILKFRAGQGDDPPVALGTAGAGPSTPFVLAGDLVYQASTRGGREVDGILAGKAQFKETAGTVGSVALVAGSQAAMWGAMTGNRDFANGGLAAMFAGLIAKGMEQASTPAADLRAWDSLPARVMLATAPGLASEPVRLSVGGVVRTAPLQAANGSCSLAWGRTRSALSADAGGGRRIAEGAPVESDRGERNQAFRRMLANELLAAN